MENLTAKSQVETRLCVVNFAVTSPAVLIYGFFKIITCGAVISNLRCANHDGTDGVRGMALRTAEFDLRSGAQLPIIGEFHSVTTVASTTSDYHWLTPRGCRVQS